MGASNVPWTESKYSKNQINKAGKKICRGDLPEAELKDAYKIVGNWRAAHAYPLHVITKKLRSLCGIDSMVVHRLKRMESIEGKLKRFPQMSLYGMQDLGGCRVIVPSVKDVYRVSAEYENSRIRHVLCKENDYLRDPKSDGYRSLHRVYEYKSDDPQSKYNRMKIEIQFRTKLQHSWATAVEVMSLYIDSNLKSGVGEDHYFRFFALVSSLFALIEDQPIVPNTPESIDELIREIRTLDKEFSLLEKLDSMSMAIQTHNRVKVRGKYDYFLMSLNTIAKEIRVGAYTVSQFTQAEAEYDRLEQTPYTNNVLASAKSMTELRKAYPNYFGDVKGFLGVLREYFALYTH